MSARTSSVVDALVFVQGTAFLARNRGPRTPAGHMTHVSIGDARSRTAKDMSFQDLDRAMLSMSSSKSASGEGLHWSDVLSSPQFSTIRAIRAIRGFV